MLYLVISILLMAIGHLVKMLRWSKFVQIYDKAQKGNLLRSLAIGHITNYIVPYHLGDIVRVILSGRKMKNGIWFSLATVIVEHYIDIIVVFVIFIGLYSTGLNANIQTILFYGVILLLIIPFTYVFVRWNRIPRKVIKNVAGIFNQEIEFAILYFVWMLISSFRDIYKKISIWKIGEWTILMWMCYLSSYWFIAEATVLVGDKYRLRDIFELMFSSSSMKGLTVYNYIGICESNIVILFAIYFISPLLIILLISFLIQDNESCKACEQLLPYTRNQDRLQFLGCFFDNSKKLWYSAFLEMNKNVSILQDLTAGSNATTMLCTDGEHIFYRKCAFGIDAEKLKKQIDWLGRCSGRIPSPIVLRTRYSLNQCCYDMEYRNTTMGFFQYIHTHPKEKSWAVMKKVLETLNKNLYRNLKSATKEDIKLYVQRKVEETIKTIENSAVLSNLVKYDTLIINGVEYPNLQRYEGLLSIENLTSIFDKDLCCMIHGDLTIDNIVCDTTNDTFYIIDPNVDNILESRNLDYAKLLQSLHGGYEFMMNTRMLSVSESRINFAYTRSSTYDYLYQKLSQYLNVNFDGDTIKSIYYHEAIHWLRLVPYKIHNDSQRAAMFYAGLLAVLKDLDGKN